MSDMERTRICFHIRDISLSGGTERVTAVLSNILLKYSDKYEIHILSSQRPNNAKPYYKTDSRVKYGYLFAEQDLKFHIPTAIKKIKEYVVRNEIDFLISVDTILSLVDIPACKNLTCKTVVWEHFNFMINMGHLRMKYARKYAAKNADHLVVLTDRDKKNYKTHLNVRANIHRIYNPLNSDFWPQKCYYDANKRKNVLVTCGRLAQQKGIDLLVEVARDLDARGVDFCWNIIGDGDEREKIEQKIDDYRLRDRVKLLGTVRDFSKFYNEAKIYVMTSRFEGLPLVLLEAQQYKLPIISFDCDCGPAEIIENGKNGILVEKNNITKMARAIEDLISDNKKCNAFSNNSQCNFPKFDEEQIFKQWEDILKKQ